MIHLISREEVFYKSWLVDHFISDIQQSAYNESGYKFLPRSSAEDPYDHMEAFHNDKEILDEFNIISYAEKNSMAYMTNRSIAFTRFFELMDIHQLYLLDELQCDWVRFPFGSSEKYETLKCMVNGADTYYEAFILDIRELSVILPLFHFSQRHSTPIIWLFSANPEIPVAMFLCDDANFHTCFRLKDREQLTSAVTTAGLIMGGLEICRM